MSPRPWTVSRGLALSLLAVALSGATARAQIGLLFSGAGPVNRSMGGAATATALDATGALYWNPATLSGLARSEIAFGVELLAPQERLASGVAGGALGPTGPPLSVAGSNRGDVGVFPLPSAGLAYRPDGSPWTYGLGVFEVAGFGTNYPASSFNPVLTAQPPRGVGLGAVYSELQVLEIAPALSYQATPHLSVGFGPLLALANLRRPRRHYRTESHRQRLCNLPAGNAHALRLGRRLPGRRLLHFRRRLAAGGFRTESTLA